MPFDTALPIFRDGFTHRCTSDATVYKTVVSTSPRTVQQMCNRPNSAAARACELPTRNYREYRGLEKVFEGRQLKMSAYVFHRKRLSKPLLA